MVNLFNSFADSKALSSLIILPSPIESGNRINCSIISFKFVFTINKYNSNVPKEKEFQK